MSYPRQFNSMCVWGEPFQAVFPTVTPTSNFPSCHSTVTNGENVASNVFPPTERGITFNHFNAAYICFSTVNSGSYFLLGLPRSSCKISILGGLVIRVGAKLLYLAECQVPRVETCVTIFDPLRLGVPAEGTCSQSGGYRLTQSTGAPTAGFPTNVSSFGNARV